MNFLPHLFAVASVLVITATAAPPWAEILGPSQGIAPPPEPGPTVWRDDLAKALDEARLTNPPALRDLPLPALQTVRRL